MVVASSASTLSSLRNHSLFILVPLPPHLPILLCSFMLYLAQADFTWALDKRVSFSPKLIGRNVLTGYIISWWMGSRFIWSQGYLRGDLLRVTRKAFSLFCFNFQKESISPFLNIGEETDCSGPSATMLSSRKGTTLRMRLTHGGQRGEAKRHQVLSDIHHPLHHPMKLNYVWTFHWYESINPLYYLS